MPIALSQDEGGCVVCLEGEINISSAAVLKAILLQWLASGADLRLDLERATELDVTALQLLWAAEREARRSGKAFAVGGAIRESVLSVGQEAGLEIFPLALGPSD